MAPAPIAGGGFGPAALPAGMAMAGTYIIVNTATNNRYIGIAGNINNRFNTRLATVTEMGFAGVPTMQAIGVTWGQTLVRNTAPAALLMAGWPLGLAGFAIIAPAPPAAFTAVIDGVAGINLEQLLIRLVITQLGAGGTVSNNAMAALPYANPTPNPITVRLTWGAMGGLFAAGHFQAVWGVGPAAAW
jgi:hypothetical protein